MTARTASPKECYITDYWYNQQLPLRKYTPAGAIDGRGKPDSEVRVQKRSKQPGSIFSL